MIVIHHWSTVNSFRESMYIKGAELQLITGADPGILMGGGGAQKIMCAHATSRARTLAPHYNLRQGGSKRLGETPHSLRQG